MYSLLMQANEAQCLVCGRTFYKTHWKQNCCSDECKKERNRENARNYYQRNKKEISTKNRIRYQTNAEYREKQRKSWKKYYSAHKEEYLKRNSERKKYSYYLKRFSICEKQHGSCDLCPYDDCKVAIELD